MQRLLKGIKDFFFKIGQFFAKTKPFFGKLAPFFKKYCPIFCKVTLCVAGAFFAAYSVMVITDTDEYISSYFKNNAYISLDGDLEKVEKMADSHYDLLYSIAAEIKAAEAAETSEGAEITETAASVEEIIEHERDLVYFADGKMYDNDGLELNADFDGYNELSLLDAGGVAGSKIYYDKSKHEDHIAFYIPVSGSDHVDGLCKTYQVRGILDLAAVRAEGTDALIIMSKGGQIAAESTSDGFGYTTGSDLRSLIDTMTHDAENVINKLGAFIAEGTRGIELFEDGERGYTLSLSPISGFGGELWLVNITENEGLMSPELAYVRHVINICVIIIAAIVIAMLYITVLYKRKNISELQSIGADSPEGCPSKESFRINATKLLQNRERKFALAVFEIRQFRYIGENITEKEKAGLLEYVAKVIQALCNARETYGYLGDGKFGLLMHIESESTVKDRVRLIESVASKNALLGASKSKRKFNIGLSMTQESQRQTYTELFGFAEIACEKAKNNINVPYVIFNEQINNERLYNERIEAEMENALATGEFRLFLQPKYNIEADRIDSAEALVRWFDTKTGDFRFPGEFIGLFESNGFITKLDHFMYIEALKFLSTAAERFDKIVPISVNVSMVTVSDPGFLDFYIENKKKYRVGDNFIVIEFTESFAMEDYEKIRAIVQALHENGIKCSLDDFGSGYSSLGTLKNIPFDELKFDRLFLSKGHNRQNDDAMLESMFRLARTMGIKVVQEGVETKEMFDNVVAKGCDIIQGYYYAKAIPVEEFRLFINSNTSIRFKSRVK